MAVSVNDPRVVDQPGNRAMNAYRILNQSFYLFLLAHVYDMGTHYSAQVSHQWPFGWQEEVPTLCLYLSQHH